MPPRLSKRQQREQEELQALAGPSKSSDEEEISEDEPIQSRSGGSKAITGFAALAGDEEEKEIDSGSDDDKVVRPAKSKKSKKKKKKGVGPLSGEAPASPLKPIRGKPKGQEIPKSKAKLKAEDDDFDKALAELSGKYSASHHPTSSKAASASIRSFDSFNSLISVSLKHLDPETELRRFFGSKIIASSGPSRPSKVRSHLARPQPAWPPAQYRAGLSMRALTPEEVQEKGTGVGPDHRERWWTVEASPRYKGTTYEYLQCVMGGDPHLFFNLMYKMPWHADTLLQMAEVFRHREEYSTAADFLSRALFSYERSFAGAFNFTTGLHRLDFDRIENRVFYLALARNVIDLNRRGTPRTAFEFARLLYSLDPHTDPHGALLHLDCLAIKGHQVDWLLDVWTAFVDMNIGKNGESRFDVTIMPGWCWARALALFEKEGEADDEHRESTTALREAIIAYPNIAPLIADKIDLVLPPELRQIDAFKIVADYSSYRDDLPTSLIHLLSHIYAIRSSSLWKIPARAAWLLKTVKSLTTTSFTPSISPRPRARIQTLFSSYSNLTDAIYRHVLVAASLAPEFQRLKAFFPGEVKARLTHAIEGDPLPSVTAVSIYDDAYFTGVAVGSRGRSAGDRMAEQLQRVFPNPIDRGQLQALFDAHPEIGARFPGGMVELAQLARQFPQEVLEAVIGMVAQNDDGNPRVLPAEEGRMPGGEVVLVQPDGQEMQDNGVDVAAAVPQEDEDNEDEDEAFFPVRIVQNLFGRLWGRNAAEGATSGSDSDDDAVGIRARADDVD